MRMFFGLLVLGCVVACTTPELNDTDTSSIDSLEGVPSGSFLMGISLAPAGGLVIPFQINLTPGNDTEGSLVFTEVSVYATKTDWTLSEPLQVLQNVPVSPEGTFEIEFNIIMPDMFSPTMSEVEIRSSISGSFGHPNFFCGTVSGQIPTFDMDLQGSTFGAILWENRSLGTAASCDDDPDATLPRMTVEDCPVLQEGTNTGFMSASLDREFELRLPPKYTSGPEWPLVFAWHGFGGTAQGFLAGDLAQNAAMRDMILVAPQGTSGGGSTSFDPFGEEKRNYDVALFDDILTCVSAQYGVDDQRTYSTGMSNGGLMTGALIARRSAILASAAPLSGGISVAFAEDHVAIPTLVTWGGEEDYAYEQNFHKLAENMISDLVDRDHFLAVCNHGLKHEVPEGAWNWVFTFLMAHERGLGTESPYAAGLSEEFPSYCVLNDFPK